MLDIHNFFIIKLLQFSSLNFSFNHIDTSASGEIYWQFLYLNMTVVEPTISIVLRRGNVLCYLFTLQSLKSMGTNLNFISAGQNDKPRLYSQCPN